MIENVVVIAALILLCIAIDVAIVVIAKIVTPKNPTPIKVQRFEAGNPPLSTPKFVLPMQYTGFLLMFLGCEPVLVLLLVLSAYPTKYFLQLMLLGFVLLIPALYYTYRFAYEIAYGGGTT